MVCLPQQYLPRICLRNYSVSVPMPKAENSAVFHYHNVLISPPLFVCLEVLLATSATNELLFNATVATSFSSASLTSCLMESIGEENAASSQQMAYVACANLLSPVFNPMIPPKKIPPEKTKKINTTKNLLISVFILGSKLLIEKLNKIRENVSVQKGSACAPIQTERQAS